MYWRGAVALPRGAATDGKTYRLVVREFEVFDADGDEGEAQRPVYLEFGVYKGRSMRWWSSHLTQDGAKLVGFDSNDILLAALKRGDIDGLVLQDPFQMGYESVKAIVSQLDGKPPAALIDTGVIVITKENIGSPEVKKLLGK